MRKTGPDIKIGPIISNINEPTQRISWLLARTLEPMQNNVPAYLGNNFELIKCIQDVDPNTNKSSPYPCSLYREFKMLLRRRQRERHKTIGFNEKTKALHVRFEFWHISSQYSAKRQREMTTFKVL